MSTSDPDRASHMPNRNVARHVPAVSSPSFWGANDRYTVLVSAEQSGGAYYVIEATVPPDGGPPPHLHRLEQESLYVLQGTLDVVIDDKTAPAAAGDVVYIPCDMVHGFRNNGDADARVLLIFTLDDSERVWDATPDAPERTTALPRRPERGAPATGLYGMLARSGAAPQHIPE